MAMQYVHNTVILIHYFRDMKIQPVPNGESAHAPQSLEFVRRYGVLESAACHLISVCINCHCGILHFYKPN